jgi:hypothetical protein
MRSIARLVVTLAVLAALAVPAAAQQKLLSASP